MYFNRCSKAFRKLMLPVTAKPSVRRLRLHVRNLFLHTQYLAYWIAQSKNRIHAGCYLHKSQIENFLHVKKANKASEERAAASSILKLSRLPQLPLGGGAPKRDMPMSFEQRIPFFTTSIALQKFVSYLHIPVFLKRCSSLMSGR